MLALERLRVASYNVLFDTFEADRLHTALRLPHIVQLIASSGADVIALQEVTPYALRYLLQQPIIRSSYWASDSPRALNCSPYGQLILSRHPFAVRTARFSRAKMAVVAALAVQLPHSNTHQSLAICAVHLTSNYQDHQDGRDGVKMDAQARRALQLGWCMAELSSYDSALIVGDFNYDVEEDLAGVDPEPIVAFRDCWREAGNPLGEHGYTFDALINPTARITSKNSKRKRYDRVIHNCPALRCNAAWRFGTHASVAIPSDSRLCPSDHYGITCVLEAVPAQAAQAPAVEPKRYNSVSELLAAQKKAVGEFHEELDRRTRVAAVVRDAVNRCQAEKGWPNMLVEVVGSTRLGCAMRDTDLDLAVVPVANPVGPANNNNDNNNNHHDNVEIVSFLVEQHEGLGEAFCTRVARELGGLVQTGGKVPIVKTHIDGIDVEICFGVRAKEAIEESRTVRRLAQKRQPHFAQALALLKIWASRCGIYGSVFGFLNGAALVTLLCRAVNELPADASAEELVRQFFRFAAQWDGKTQVVTLPGCPWTGRLDRQVLPVSTPAGRLILRNATRSTQAAVLDAFAVCQRLYDDGLSTLLLQERHAASGQPKFFDQFPHYVTARCQWEGEAWARPVSDWFASRAVGLVLALEQVQCVDAAIPYPRLLRLEGAASGCSVLVGLRGAPDISALRVALNDWEAMLRPSWTEGVTGVVSEHVFATHGLSRRPFTAPNVFLTQQQQAQAAQQRQNEAAAAAAAGEGNDGANGEEEAAVAVDWEAELRGVHCELVYKRVLWDPHLTVDDWEIGWEDRFVGIMRKPITVFKPGGAVPWHRVRVFWHQGKVVWSRGDIEELMKRPKPE